jgi:alpha-ketoglutarate-dependent taurine dioxygenase
VVPITPSIGADVFGLDLRTINKEELALVEELFDKHKVLFFRGQDAMTTDDQIHFARSMGKQWKLPESTNRTPQWKLTEHEGCFLGPPFAQDQTFAEEQGAEWMPHVIIATQGDANIPGGRSTDDSSGSTIIPGAKIWNDVSNYTTGTRLKKRLAHGGELYRGRGTWRRPSQHHGLFGGNVWHTDNQYTQNPPWATTLRAVALPANGGDTCFANMEAVYEDLDDASQALLDSLTQVVDWEVR